MSIRNSGKTVGEPKDRLMLGVCGRRKRGKTHLALTAPEPIFLFNLDHGLNRVVQKFDKEVYYEDYLVPSKVSDKKKEDVLERFIRDFFDTIYAEKEGTVLIDTFTQVWDLVYSTELESILESSASGNVYPFYYADANSIAENLIQAVEETELNLVVTERMSQAYDDSGNPIQGRYKPKGYKGIPYLVDVFGRVRTEGSRRYFEIWENRMSKKVGTSDGSYIKVYDPTFESIKAVALEGDDS